MDTVEVIRIVNLLIRVTVVGLCAVAWARRPHDGAMTSAPVTWALHGLVFYSVLLLDLPLDRTVASLWASALGLHVGFLIVGGVIIFLWPARGARQ